MRDEFFIKLVVGRLTGESDPANIIDHQRQAYLTQLRDLTALVKRAEDPNVELMVEGAILHLQADLRWLDLCDERLEHSSSSG